MLESIDNEMKNIEKRIGQLSKEIDDRTQEIEKRKQQLKILSETRERLNLLWPIENVKKNYKVKGKRISSFHVINAFNNDTTIPLSIKEISERISVDFPEIPNIHVRTSWLVNNLRHEGKIRRENRGKFSRFYLAN